MELLKSNVLKFHKGLCERLIVIGFQLSIPMLFTFKMRKERRKERTTSDQRFVVPPVPLSACWRSHSNRVLTRYRLDQVLPVCAAPKLNSHVHKFVSAVGDNVYPAACRPPESRSSCAQRTTTSQDSRLGRRNRVTTS